MAVHYRISGPLIGAGGTEPSQTQPIGQVFSTSGRDRRQTDRISLEDAHGELAYRGTVFPCEVIDISIGGCCIRTEKRFAAGALANVEVVLPLFGMTLRIVGTTQWLNQQNLIGIRFVLPSAKSKNQLASLITCIIDSDALAEVQEAMTSAALHESPGLAISVPLSLMKKPEAEPVFEDAPGSSELGAVHHAIHGEERRVLPTMEGEWKAIFRNPANELQLRGELLDLSSLGCNLRCGRTCGNVLHAQVEIEFEMLGLHLQLSGVVHEVYDARTCGIQFSPMTQRKLDSLAQLIEELHAASQKPSQLPVAAKHPENAPAMEPLTPEKDGQDKGQESAEKSPKKRFWHF
jgi:hypothetical protein